MRDRYEIERPSSSGNESISKDDAVPHEIISKVLHHVQRKHIKRVITYSSEGESVDDLAVDIEDHDDSIPVQLSVC
jgi:hypothetical protein